MFEELTALVKPTEHFIDAYSEDFSLIFNLSAKHRHKRRPLHPQHIDDIEVWGPDPYMKEKDVEYTLFLPYFLKENDDPKRLNKALNRMFKGLVFVLRNLLEMNVDSLLTQQNRIISEILSDPKMLDSDENWFDM